MKLTAPLSALAVAALLAPAVFAADSSDRTSMPSNCSERDVNCVIQNGPPRRRGTPDRQQDKDKRGNTPPGTDRSGSAPASGAIVDPAGVTRK